MKREILLCIALATILGAPAWAKPHRKTRKSAPKKLEVYSAIEADGVETVPTDAEEEAPAVIKAQAPVTSAPIQEAIQAQRQEIYEQEHPTPAPRVDDGSPALGYDPVPSDQSDSVARRLKVVELIIRRHGRAYDYRAYTNKELLAILAKLEKARKPAHES